MKKTLIAVAALAATGAFAQVTISGSMQVGLVNSGVNDASTTVQHLGNGANAINLAASEDLGGGLKAGWDGQIRFNAASGDRNSSGDGYALFHNSNVYLSSATLGTVRIGKIAEISNGAFDPWALGGGASLGSGFGQSITVGAAAVPSAVGYTSPTFMGFSFGAQKGQSDRINERSIAHLSYANGPIAAQFLLASGASPTANDATFAASNPLTDAKATQQSIAASYNFGVAKVNLVNVIRKSATDVKTADIMSVSGSIPLSGAMTVLVGYNKAKTGLPTGATSANDTKVALGLNYGLSKRTTLGVDVFQAEAANADTGYVLRMRHTF